MSNINMTYGIGIGFDVNKLGLSELKSELNKIQQLSKLDFRNLNTQAPIDKLKEVQNTAKQVGKVLEESFNPKLNTINLETFRQKLEASGGSIHKIQKDFSELGDVGKDAFRKLATELLTTNREVRETYSLFDKLGETLSNTIKWSIASSAINTVTGSIQKAWNYAIKLDTSLNDIRIVTSKSADEMDRFAKKANKAAQSLAASTTNYSKAALIYYQQGLDEVDVGARTQATVKAANVTGQSTAEVSQQLTAVWNGYKVVAEEAELYVDKLAAVAATTAADLEELSEGMSKVASAANTMGVDVDQLSAQLATIVSVTRQDASAVGTALKTIYARMGDLKVSGIDEFGTSLGDVSGQMRQMGIDVLDQEGNLRDMGSVIEEVAKKWGTWTDAQQQAAAVAMAGKRQYNNLIALFENWDMYESALTTSRTSEGTLQKQQDIYMDSLEAHLQKIATAGEKVYDALFDSESMKDVLDLIALAVDGFGELVESIGGGGNLLLMFGSVAGKALGKQFGSWAATAVKNFQNLKFNISQANAEIKLTRDLEESNIEKGKLRDEQIQRLVDIKKEHLKLEKSITEEQRKQNNLNLIAIAKNMEKQNDLAQEGSDLNERFLEMQGLTDTDSKTRKAIDMKASGFNSGSALDIELEDNLEETTTRVNNEKEALEKLNEIQDKKIAEAEAIRRQAQEKFKKENDANVQALEEERKNLEEQLAKIEEREKVSREKLKNKDSDREKLKDIKVERKDVEKNLAKVNKDIQSNQSNYAENEKAAIEATEELIEKNKELKKIKEDINQQEKLTKIAEEDNKSAKEKFNKVQANKINLNEAISMASNVKEFSKNVAGYTGKSIAALEEVYNTQSLEQEYRNKYNIAEDQLIDYDAEIANLQGSKVVSPDPKNKPLSGAEKSKNEKIDRQIKDLKKLKEAQDKANKSLKDFYTLNKKIEGELKGITTGEDKNEKLTQGAINKELELNKIREKSLAVLEKVKNKTPLTGDDLEILNKYLKSYKGLNVELNESVKTSGEFVQDAKKALNQIETAAMEEEKQRKENEDTLKQERIQAITKGVTEIAGAAMSLMGILGSLRNTANILFDDSIGGAEKTTTVISTLLSIVLTAIPMINSFKTGIDNLGISFSKAGISIGKAGAIAKLGWIELALIIGAIVAVIGLLSWGFSALADREKKIGDNGKKAFEKASNAAENAKKEVEATTAAYEDLKKSLEDYNDAQKAIEELRTGTEEWKDAIQDANGQVIDLINNYPSLSKYVKDINGQLIIDEEDQKEVLKQQEKAVNSAEAGLLRANANKKKAQNRMLLEDGADYTMKKIDEDRDLLGASIGGTVGGALGGIMIGAAFGPLGMLIGGAIGAAAGAIIASTSSAIGSAEDKWRNEAYEKAIEVVQEQGNAVLADKKRFEEEMNKKGITDKEYINALYKNSSLLEKNSAQIEANTKAAQLEEQQATSVYLEGASDVYKNSQFKNAIAKIITAETGEESDLYKKKVTYYAGKNGTITDDSDTEKGQAKRTGEAYADLMGIDYESFRYDHKNDAFVYTTAQGTRTVDTAQAIAAVASNDALEASLKMVKEIEDALNGMSSHVMNTAKGLIEGLSNTVQGETGSFVNATEKELSGLDNAVQGGKEQLATFLGMSQDELENFAVNILNFESVDDYLNHLGRGIKDYKAELSEFEVRRSVWQDTSVNSYLPNFENYSLAQKEAIFNAIAKGYSVAGESGAEVISNIINNSNLTKDQQKQVADIYNNINWEKGATAINDFKIALDNANISISDSSENWTTFNTEMEKSVNWAAAVTTSFTELRNLLASFNEVVSKLKLGEIISDEEYKTLLNGNAALSEFFAQTEKGWMLIDSGSTFRNAVAAGKKRILNPEGIFEGVAAARQQSKNTFENKDWYYKDSEGNITGIKEEKKTAFMNALTGVYGDVDELLGQMGLNEEELKNAFFGNYSNISVGEGDKQKTYSLSVLAGMEAEALASATGITKEEAANIIISARSVVNTNNENKDLFMEQALNFLSNSTTDEAWNKLVENELSTSLAGTATNYNELKAAAKDISLENLSKEAEGVFNEVYEKLAKGYLAQEAEELGIATLAWERYAKAHNIEEQDTYLAKVAELQSYNEIDYYANINKELENLEKTYEDLADTEGKLIKGSKNYLDNLDEQIVANGELIEKLKARRAEQDNQIALNKEVLLGSGWLGEGDFGSDGTVNEEAYNEVFDEYQGKLQAGTLTEEEKEDYLKFLNDVLNYNELINKTNEETNDRIKEAAETALDSQIKKFSASIELKLELAEAKQEWLDFKAKYLERGVNIFGDLTSLENIFSLTQKIPTAQKAFNESLEHLNQFYKEDGSVKTWEGMAAFNYSYTDEKGGKIISVSDEASYKKVYDDAIKNASDSFENLFDYAAGLSESYAQTQEEIVQLYDKQINRVSKLSSLIRGQVDLSKLLGKETSQYYSTLTNNSIKNYEVAIAKSKTLEEEYRKAFDEYGQQLVSDEQLKNLEENMASAAEAAVAATKDAIAVVIEQMTEGFKEAIDIVFTEALGNRFTYSYLSTKWELDLQMDERYLDEINSAYKISELDRTIQKSIDNTDSLYAQQKLNELREKELNMLKEKDKLTQYDLDHANAMYELTLKQIALEEAQQTTNKMKLTRDAMGNYTYQYVADQDAIAEAEAAVAAAENNLYNINKDEAKARIGEVFSLMEEGYTKVAELREQNRDAEADLVWQQYFGEGGLVGTLTESFGAINENMNKINLSFKDSSIGDIFTKLSQIDYEKFGHSMETTYENAEETMTQITATMEELLGESSPLVASINNLTEAFGKDVQFETDEKGRITGVTSVEGVKDRTNITANLAVAIGSLSVVLNDYAKDLSEKMERYITTINGDALNTNTEALETNSKRIENLNSLLAAQMQLNDGNPDNDEGAKEIIDNILSLY